MGFKYSLFVNGKSLGPYERRMIVGMRVKNIVKDDQIVMRDDGVDMTVAQLMQDRYEAVPPARSTEAVQESVLGAPSSGMWPQFIVRYGGGPVKPGALGFTGSGQISYHGDVLRFKGNRRNKNLGMSRQEENLPVRAIATSMVEGSFIEIYLQPGLGYAESIEGTVMRLECTTDEEATELWELLNMGVGQMPGNHAFARTAAGELR
jgi:hypothetical protein